MVFAYPTYLPGAMQHHCKKTGKERIIEHCWQIWLANGSGGDVWTSKSSCHQEIRRFHWCKAKTKKNWQKTK
jgi:hypothetical protein